MTALVYLEGDLIDCSAAETWDDLTLERAWRKERSADLLRRIARWGGIRAWRPRPPGPARRLTRDEEYAWIRKQLPAPPPLQDLIAVSSRVQDIGIRVVPAADFAAAATWLWVQVDAGGEDPISYLWRTTRIPHELVEILQLVDNEPAFELAMELTLVSGDVDYDVCEESACNAIRGLVDEEPRGVDLQSANQRLRARGERVLDVAGFMERASPGDLSRTRATVR